LDGYVGVEPRKVGIALAEFLHNWRKWAMFLLNYSLAFAIQLSKSVGNLSQDC
jgi:hypothetical protein